MPDGEAQTELLVNDALQAGKSVFVPHLHKPDPTQKRKVMEMLRLESLKGLERDAWGIPTLTNVEGRENALESEEGLDVIVMPAVAFDRAGDRLGHGAGFYDRFLERGWGQGSARRKPFLGACELRSCYHLVIVTDHRCSRSLSHRASNARRAVARNGGVGLEGRCCSRWRWRFADFLKMSHEHFELELCRDSFGDSQCLMVSAILPACLSCLLQADTEEQLQPLFISPIVNNISIISRCALNSSTLLDSHKTSPCQSQVKL